MQRSQIRLKQLLISITMLVIYTSGLQVQANSNPNYSEYRLQKVVSNSNQQDSPIQQQTTTSKSTTPTALRTNFTNNTKTSSSLDSLPLIVLALVVLGLLFVLFAPGRFIRKPIIIDKDINDSANTPVEKTADTIDLYMESMDAEEDIEQQLDAEEQYESMDIMTERTIASRDRKSHNRVVSRRKR